MATDVDDEDDDADADDDDGCYDDGDQSLSQSASPSRTPGNWPAPPTPSRTPSSEHCSRRGSEIPLLGSLKIESWVIGKWVTEQLGNGVIG
jgi:hypothetical protein